MKKLLLLLLILPFMACSNDDEDYFLSKDLIIGTWDVYSIDNNELGKDAAYITLREDDKYSVKFLSNSYTGTYKIDGNTVIGTTLDPITEYYRFTSLENNEAVISYSNSIGDKYIFHAKKTKE